MPFGIFCINFKVIYYYLKKTEKVDFFIYILIYYKIFKNLYQLPKNFSLFHN